MTDFGLGNWQQWGLVLVNLADEPEYCEKLMYAKKGMVTPSHCHHRKKEDIIVRFGQLEMRVWGSYGTIDLKRNGLTVAVKDGSVLKLRAGERVTLVPGVYHEFRPISDECIIGEVSTANDDLHDNVFVNEAVGRFPGIEEDEPALLKLVSEVS